MRLERHLLAEFSPAARADLAAKAIDGLLEPFRADAVAAQVDEWLARHAVPGIVCRPTRPVGLGEVQLGLSFPFRVDEARVRSAVVVGRADIVTFTDPFAVASRGCEQDGPIGRIVRATVIIAAALGIEAGVIGSAALEIVTGAPYTSERSDLDLVVRGGDLAALGLFRKRIAATGRAVDVEVMLTDGRGVKLSELLGPSRTLLAKSLSAVTLAERADVLAVLTGRSQASFQDGADGARPQSKE